MAYLHRAKYASNPRDATHCANCFFLDIFSTHFLTLHLAAEINLAFCDMNIIVFILFHKMKQVISFTETGLFYVSNNDTLLLE